MGKYGFDQTRNDKNSLIVLVSNSQIGVTRVVFWSIVVATTISYEVFNEV